MSKAVIFLNGELSRIDLIRPYLNGVALGIGADGGARHARAHGLPLQVIVGDLDSIDSDTLEHYQKSGAEICRFPTAKDHTDLELALDCAEERGADEIHIVAFEGGRVDHLFLLGTVMAKRSESVREIWAYDQTGRFTAVRGGQTVQLNVIHGKLISLIPLSEDNSGVVLTGTEWTLEGAELPFGFGRTVSNRAREEVVTVSLSHGVLLVFVEH